MHFCRLCHMTLVRCHFNSREHVAMERGSSMTAEKRSWGPLHEEPFILSGCFLYKNQFLKRITKRNSGSWKGLNPENETTGECQYLRMKFGQIEEQRTLYYVPFLLLILASFSFKYRFGSAQNGSKSCLPLIQGMDGEHEV